MAIIKGQQTVNEVLIIEVSGDPSASGGTPAPTGSIALDDSGKLWIKKSAVDTDWLEQITTEYASDVISTGVVDGLVLSIGTPNTTFTLSAGTASFSNDILARITITEQSNQPLTYLNTNLVTYIGLDSFGAIVQQVHPFTNTQRRTIAAIGVVVHSNLTNVNAVNQTQSVALHPLSQLKDLEQAIGPFNINGNIFMPNGANLLLDKTNGEIFKTGSNWETDQYDPNTRDMSPLVGLTFRYRLQDGTEFADTTSINPNIYDVGGVSTSVPGNKFTIQRIYIFSSNLVRIQPGQAIYSNIADAIEGILTESYITETNIYENGLIRAFLVIKSGTTSLLDSNNVRLLEAPKFGGSAGVGGVSNTTLQKAYNNSETPEIVTNSALGAVTVKRGSAADTDNVFEIQNGAGAITAQITGTGVITGSNLSGTNTGDQDLSGYVPTSRTINGNALTSDIILTNIDIPDHLGFDTEIAVTDNGDGSITLPTMTVAFYKIGSSNGEIVNYIVAGGVVSLINLSTNYIVADRDTLTFTTLTDKSLIDYVRYMPYGVCYRSGTNVHNKSAPILSELASERIFRRITDVSKFARLNGFELSCNSSLEVTITAGEVWENYTKVSQAASSTSSRGFYPHHVSGVWTTNSALNPKINNTQYDNGTDYVTLSAGHWTINWIFRGIEDQDHVYIQVGNAEYATAADASAVKVVPPSPDIVTSHTMLVGRIIVQKNATSNYFIESAFPNDFAGATPASFHNISPDLQGGAPGDYYHLTGTEAARLAAIQFPIDAIKWVAKTGNDTTGTGTTAAPFLTITKALAVAGSEATITTPRLVMIQPGTFTEPELTVPAYVSVYGQAINAVIIEPDANNHNVVNLSIGSEISFLTIQGAGSGYAGISVVDIGDFAQAHKITIVDCDINILISASTIDTFFYGEYVDYTGTYSYGTKVISTSGFIAHANMENYYNLPFATTSPNIFNYVDGSKAELYTPLSGNKGTGVETAHFLTGGALLEQTATYIDDCNIGLYTEEGSKAVITTTFDGCTSGIVDKTTGTGSIINATGSQFINCTNNITVTNPATTGSFTGQTAHALTDILNESGFFITNKDLRIVTVAHKGGDHTSIKDAIDTITDADVNNRYLVRVGPGVFTEAMITMKPYVYVEGSGDDVTIIVADNTNHHVIVGCDNSGIRKCTLDGATDTGKCAIYYGSLVDDSHKIFYAREVRFGNNDILVDINTDGGYTVFIAQNIRVGKEYTFNRGFLCHGSHEGRNVIFESSSTGGIPSPYPSTIFEATSPGCEIIVQACIFYITANNGTGVVLENGGVFRCNGLNLKGFSTGLQINNTGAAPKLDVLACSFIECTDDIICNHAGTMGAFQGSLSKEKVTIASGTPASFSYSNLGTGGGSVTLGPIYQGSRHDRLIDTSTMIRLSTTLGVGYGGEITPNTGLSIHVAAGTGFLVVNDISEPAGHYLLQVTWSAADLTLTASSENYIYINSSSVVSFATSPQDMFTAITLGKVKTTATGVDFFEIIPRSMHHQGDWVENMLREAFGPVYAKGSIVNENATPFELDVSSGEYYYGSKEVLPAGGTAITFEHTYRDGSSGWTIATGQTAINNTQYDNNSGTLVSIPTGEFAKHSLFLVGDGAFEKYMLVFGQETFSTLNSAETGNDPVPPPYFNESVVKIATIIIEEGNANIAKILDTRPRLSFKAASSAGVTVHGELSGLSADDHTQYLLVSGARAMTGALDMGAQNITNVNLVDGVDVSAHASRHLPNGADPLTTATASSVSTTNTVGVANSLSRSDHTHQGVHSYKVDSGTPRFGDLNLISGYGMILSDDGSGNVTVTANVATAQLIPLYTAGLFMDYTAGNVIINGTYYHINAGSIAVTPSQTNWWMYVNTSGVVEQGATLPAYAHPIAIFTTDALAVTSFSDRRTWTNANYVFGAPSVNLSASTSNSGGSSFSMARADHSHAITTGAAANQTPDQTSAAGSSSSLARADHIHNIPAGVPVTIDSANSKGTAATFALSDHIHDHGSQTTATHHAVATTSLNGFMSSTDKTKLDSIKPKAGQVAAVSFTGSPRKATVTLATPYPNTNYSIVIMGVDSRAWSYESKLAGSFVINSRAATALTGEVSWITLPTGDL